MQLSEFINRLEHVQSSGIMSDIKREVATGGLKLIDKTFQSETDPYGAIWPEVKYHTGHRSTLQDSGVLRQSFIAWALEGGVKFLSTCVYAATQQYGRAVGDGRITGRKMIPVESKGLPTDWILMIQKAIISRFNQGFSS